MSGQRAGGKLYFRIYSFGDKKYLGSVKPKSEDDPQIIESADWKKYPFKFSPTIEGTKFIKPAFYVTGEVFIDDTSLYLLK